MDPVHAANFVSCEDSLVKPALVMTGLGIGGSLSVHNIACTATGIVILAAVPYAAFCSAPARRIESSTTTTTKTSLISNSNKQNNNNNIHRIKNKNNSNAASATRVIKKNVVTTKSYTPEVWAYLIALTYLFYANVHQHATGYVFWDLDVGGAIHSIFLSLMIYENCKHTLQTQLGLPQIPTLITRSIAVAATIIELITPLIRPTDIGRKIASTIGGIASLTVVPFIGRAIALHCCIAVQHSLLLNLF